ncbi:hypothetical protein VPHD128_0088 [Vibrio phage D128]
MSPLQIIQAMRDQKGSYSDALMLAYTECLIYRWEFPELVDIHDLDPRSDYHYVITHLITEHAKYLYYKHMGLGRRQYDYMWGQCSGSVVKAWQVIADADAEDPLQQPKE